jgi:thymidine phosphorylase
VTAIDGQAVGLAAMRLGAGRVKKGDPIDAAVGIVLERKVGDTVRRGETLAVVHARTGEAAAQAVDDIAAAYAIGDGTAAAPALILGTIA